MLRISTDTAYSETTTIRLEGKLLLDWIGALRDVYDHAASLSLPIVFDMRGVSYIDAPCVIVLREWQRRGLIFSHCSPWIAELLKEIH